MKTADGLDRRPAWAVGAAALAVLLVWWLGFYPGISTVDTQQAWDQARDWVFVDWHPVFHTWVIAVLTRIWFSPAVVTLAHVVALSAVASSLTRRFQRARLPLAVAVAVPVLLVLSPQTGFTTMVIWKDIPFAIALLWVFAETVDVVSDPRRFFASRWRCARLGSALLAVLLFRQNGLLVAGIPLAGLCFAYRRHWRELALPVVIALGGFVAVTGPGYKAVDAWPTPVLFTYTTFIHDMGAFVTYHGDDMQPGERAFLSRILPLERWRAPDPERSPSGLYYCRQATPMIFPPEFYPAIRLDREGRLVPRAELPRVITQNPESVFLEQHKGEFRRLWLRFVRRWPGTFLGHRFCVGSLAWSPWHKTGLEVFQPPLQSTVDRPELQVRPASPAVNSFLTDVLRFWGRDGRRVLTWRAVPWVYAGFAALVVGWRRRRSWRALLIGLPGLAAWFSVLTFTPGQSARYMFPAYLCALASLAFFAPVRPAAGSDDTLVRTPDTGRDTRRVADRVADREPEDAEATTPCAAGS